MPASGPGRGGGSAGGELAATLAPAVADDPRPADRAHAAQESVDAPAGSLLGLKGALDAGDLLRPDGHSRGGGPGPQMIAEAGRRPARRAASKMPCYPTGPLLLLA